MLLRLIPVKKLNKMKATRKYLEHTADILFQAEASTLPELFEQCALAVEESQIPLDNVETREKKEITGKNKKIDLLLFDFLDDLLLYKDSELLIFSKFDIKIDETGSGDDKEYVLMCTAHGEKIDPEKHSRDVDVKAITMHMFEVEKTEDGWKAQVLLDI